MTKLNHWQDPEDGYPIDEYFDTVVTAIEAFSVTVDDCWRDEPWDYGITLGEGCRKGYAELSIHWRVDEQSEPLTGDWRALHAGICGWYWVPVSEGREQEALGDFAEAFDLPVLAEPTRVASAVASLVKDGAK